MTGVVVRGRHRNGSYLWMEATAEVLVDICSHPDGVVGGFVDIDELVETRNRIRQDARAGCARSSTACSIPTPCSPRCATSPGGSSIDYADVNEVGVQYMRAPRDELLGRRISAVLPGIVDNGLLGQLIGAMKTGTPLVLEDFLFQAFEVTGSDRHFEVRAVRIGESLSVISQHVTDQRETAAALAASEQQYRLLAENSSDVVVRSRGESIIWVSPSLTTMLGWTPEYSVHRHFVDFVHPDDVKRLRRGRGSHRGRYPVGASVPAPGPRPGLSLGGGARESPISTWTGASTEWSPPSGPSTPRWLPTSSSIAGPGTTS